jgi:hypothetical protein
LRVAVIVRGARVRGLRGIKSASAAVRLSHGENSFSQYEINHAAPPQKVTI